MWGEYDNIVIKLTDKLNVREEESFQTVSFKCITVKSNLICRILCSL